MAKVKFIGTMGSAGILCLDEQTADSKGAKVNITNRKPGVILVVEDEFLIRLDAVDMCFAEIFDGRGAVLAALIALAIVICCSLPLLGWRNGVIVDGSFA